MPNESDDLAPVAALLLHVARQVTGDRQHPRKRLCARQQCLATATKGGRSKSGLRQGDEAAPRNRVNHGRPIRIFAQSQSGVGHRQSVADDQHRVLRRQGFRQLPGVIAIRGVIADRPGPRQQRRRRIAQRQYHTMRHDRCAIRDLDLERHTCGARRDMPDLAEYPQQPRTFGCRRFGLQQQVLQVIAIERTRQKVLSIRIWQLAPGKPQKLQGIARVGRQPRRRYVEEIGKIARGVRHAAAHGRAALYQHDVGGTLRRTAQQIRGQDSAAETGAHDDQGITRH